VELPLEAWERLAAWADLNAPFYGTWGEIPQFCKEPEGARRLASVNARAMELRRKHVPMGPHPDYDAIPETPRFDTTPVIPVPPKRPADVASTCADWPFDAAQAAARQQQAAVEGTAALWLDLGGGVRLELVRIPGGSFLMGSSEGPHDEAPRAVVEVRPFWMARSEVANRQYRQFRPEHESRTEDRHGYQFGIVGYDQDQPDQPAVRVSWHEAAEFCRWLSTRSGMRVSLPTEAQWEWACRGGTDTAFWFGSLEADYASFANLGDKRLADFAADTSLDNYSAARPMDHPNRYDDWLPRDTRFDDGGFVTEPVGRYRGNPWGLQDMHGNAAEWTRSLYRPYPYVERDGRESLTADGVRVVRGGSWRDRPHRATSSYRLAYAPWQRVFNVGFRIVCEGPEGESAAVLGGKRAAGN
jgi:formylglycine-generating enzyme required for sulfatase activity